MCHSGGSTFSSDHLVFLFPFFVLHVPNARYTYLLAFRYHRNVVAAAGI